jgi:copper chaperone
MKVQELTIQGMSCQHCVMSLKKELSKVAGVTIEQVEIGKARISIDETTVTKEMIANAVDEAGYKLVM